jgi:hypothetical protein
MEDRSFANGNGCSAAGPPDISKLNWELGEARQQQGHWWLMT